MTDGFQMIGDILAGDCGRTAGTRNRRTSTASDAPTRSTSGRRSAHDGVGNSTTSCYMQELVAEKRLGRVLGPTRAPAWLGVQAAVIQDQLDADIPEEPPPGEHFLAGSFAVCQTDEAGELKVRRAEDWRRSGYKTCQPPPLHRQLRGPGPMHGGGDARPDRLRPTRSGSGRSECRRNAARSWAHDTASPFGTTSP